MSGPLAVSLGAALHLALALLTEVIEEPGASAMNEIIWTMLDRVREIEEEYSSLFRLHNPFCDQDSELDSKSNS